MFNRSRKKIILSIMGSLILLLSVTLTVIYFASYHEIRSRDSDMLRDYVSSYTLEQKPDSPNPPGQTLQRRDPPPNENRGFQLSTFYSVALAEDGTVLAVDTGMRDVYSEEDLTVIAKEILSGSITSGRMDNLSYSVSSRSGYTLVAFMDNTVTESSMHTMLRYVLIVGSASIIVLFFISLYLAKRIILPLEENDEKQKRFISDASHELKTPVSVISANAELLSRELGENEWLSNIRYENDRMGELVKQLLDLSRAENKETSMEELDFSRVVTGESLAFESLAFDKGKILRSDIDESIIVIGSQTQLTQIVSVLLDNAIKHSTGTEITVSLKRQGHTAVLTVENEGKTIPAEKCEHLFDRFYRLDESRTGEGQHYGLGLSIAKAIAEKHDGSIGVSCHDGKVRFTVSVPAKIIKKVQSSFNQPPLQ